MQKKVLSNSLTNVQLGSEFQPGRIGLAYVLFLLLQDTRGISVIHANEILKRLIIAASLGGCAWIVLTDCLLLPLSCL